MKSNFFCTHTEGQNSPLMHVALSKCLLPIFSGSCSAVTHKKLESFDLTISLISSIHGETQSERSGFPRHSPSKPHCHLAEPETTMNSKNRPLKNRQNKSLLLYTVKPVLSGHSKRRPKIGFQEQLSLNAGLKSILKHVLHSPNTVNFASFCTGICFIRKPLLEFSVNTEF